MNDIVSIIATKNNYIERLFKENEELKKDLEAQTNKNFLLYLELTELQNQFDQYKLESIKWSTADFIDLGDDYDITADKAQMALEDMINSHYCNNGITWDTIQYYKEKYGTEKSNSN